MHYNKIRKDVVKQSHLFPCKDLNDYICAQIKWIVHVLSHSFVSKVSFHQTKDLIFFL